MNTLEKFLGKRKREAALRELRKRIMTDSLMIRTPNNSDSIDAFKQSALGESVFIFYPIALNKNTKYTQYIHAVISPDHKVTTPLTWETIRFIKESLNLDLESLHKVGFDMHHDGNATRPFNQCYSILSIGWGESEKEPKVKSS